MLIMNETSHVGFSLVLWVEIGLGNNNNLQRLL